MNQLDLYINKLKNKEEIRDIEEKIVNQKLKIDNIDSERLIIKKCVEEMENKLFKLKNKLLQYPDNEKIEEEIENTEIELNKGNKILNDMNHGLSRKDLTILAETQFLQSILIIPALILVF